MRLKLPIFHLGTLDGKKYIFSFNGSTLSVINRSLTYNRKDIAGFHLIFFFILNIRLHSGKKITFILKPILSRTFRKVILNFLHPHLRLIYTLTFLIFLTDLLISSWIFHFSSFTFPVAISIFHSAINYFILRKYIENRHTGISAVIGVHFAVIAFLSWLLPHTRLLNTFLFILLLIVSSVVFLIKYSRALLFLTGVTLTIIQLQTFNFAAKIYMENLTRVKTSKKIHTSENTILCCNKKWTSPVYWGQKRYTLFNAARYHDLTITHILPFEPSFMLLDNMKDDQPLKAILFIRPVLSQSIPQYINKYLSNTKKILWPILINQCRMSHFNADSVSQAKSKDKFQLISCPFLNSYYKRVEYVHFLFSNHQPFILSFLTLENTISKEIIHPLVEGFYQRNNN